MYESLSQEDQDAIKRAKSYFMFYPTDEEDEKLNELIANATVGELLDALIKIIDQNENKKRERRAKYRKANPAKGR